MSNIDLILRYACAILQPIGGKLYPLAKRKVMMPVDPNLGSCVCDNTSASQPGSPARIASSCAIIFLPVLILGTQRGADGIR
jgi:hypothetical protein